MNGLNGELPTAPRRNTARTVFVLLDITESEALPWAYSPALAGGWILGTYKYPLAGSKTIPPGLGARRTCLELNVVMLLPLEEELEVSDDVALVDVEEDDVSVEDDEDEVEVWFVLVAAMGDDVDATCLDENEV